MFLKLISPHQVIIHGGIENRVVTSIVYHISPLLHSPKFQYDAFTVKQIDREIIPIFFSETV